VLMSSNTPERARKWLNYIAGRPEFPRGSRLLSAFSAGEITRLCDCGCNRFDLELPDDTDVEPIATANDRYGAVFQLDVPLRNEPFEMNFIVFASKRGHLAGIDVDYNGNTLPVPDDPDLLDVPSRVEVAHSLLR